MSIFDTYGVGYNPNLINLPAFQQRTMVPNPPTINALGRPRDLEKVNGMESARQYQMPPNSRVALFDANDDIFYVKETDASGFPTIRTFRFVEEVTQASTTEEHEYLTVEEFNKFKEELLNGQQPIQFKTGITTTPAATGSDGISTKSKSGKSKTNATNV